MVNLLNYTLPETFTGTTWSGLTWAVSVTGDDETEFASELVSARFQLRSETGGVALTLSSENAEEVTLESTAADAWSIIVEKQDLTIAPGTYTYGLETTDADGITKPRMAGTLLVKPDPVI
jgi:hypothetical protein